LLEADLKEVLRYGENSHQKAALYSTNAKVGVVAAEQLQGKELSYNNINDSDSAYNLVAEFTSPAVVIVKHANPCGVAVGADVFAAFNQALYADPVSAFGGIIAINRTVDGRTAQAISKLFAEVVIAPDYEPEALAIFASKKNLRVLKTGVAESDHHNLLLKSITGGVLVQENDFKIPRESDLRLVTKLSPTPAQIADLLFAAKVCKHVKSNAIVIAQNNFTIGVGAGQMSRVESVNIAVQKARKMVKVDPELNNLVLASDAFFPFPDGVVIAAEAGVKAIIQPGGSIQDKDVINIADELNIAMVFSSIRNFKH
jgi:phosphoribosylaminoimidazolecarboxamide formyltransferase/IMP cyclohydrolase